MLSVDRLITGSTRWARRGTDCTETQWNQAFFPIPFHSFHRWFTFWPAGCCCCRESGGSVETSASSAHFVAGSRTPLQGGLFLPGLHGPGGMESSWKPPLPVSHRKQQLDNRPAPLSLRLEIKAKLYVSPACCVLAGAPGTGHHQWKGCWICWSHPWAPKMEAGSWAGSVTTLQCCLSAEGFVLR